MSMLFSKKQLITPFELNIYYEGPPHHSATKWHIF